VSFIRVPISHIYICYIYISVCVAYIKYISLHIISIFHQPWSDLSIQSCPRRFSKPLPAQTCFRLCKRPCRSTCRNGGAKIVTWLGGPLDSYLSISYIIIYDNDACISFYDLSDLLFLSCCISSSQTEESTEMMLHAISRRCHLSSNMACCNPPNDIPRFS